MKFKFYNSIAAILIFVCTMVGFAQSNLNNAILDESCAEIFKKYVNLGKFNPFLGQ